MNLDEQVALLMQGTEYGDEQLKNQMAQELRERLIEADKQGRPLKVYCGFDPRTSDLHIGHTIPIRKLRQFQDAGHEVTFLVGTGTSMVGDPSDKDKLREVLPKEQILENAKTYAEQAFKILDREKTIIRYNHEWLMELDFAKLIEIGSLFTIQQFLQRENFKLRFEKNAPIYLHETFYALMQAYDAYHLETDVQVGGTDQLFNIITAGRKVQKALGQKPQIGIIIDILPGTDGTVKMSKSLGNHIPILSTPEDMYGKVMSVPDHAMGLYFRLVTRWLPKEIEQIEQDLASGKLHPRDVKMKLAREIVSIYHDEEKAEMAETHFKTVFQQRNVPDEMPEHRFSEPISIVDLVFSLNLAKSKSEVRRLINQNGIRLDGETVTSFDHQIQPDKERILNVGKRHHVRLIPA